jgi:hypothetical protein
VHLSGDWPVETDPDLMIYAGGFFPDADRRQMDQLRRLSPQALAQARFNFRDPRLETMLFRYRARNWPETLSQEEREEWDSWRFQRLTNPKAGANILLDGYRERLAVLRAEFANHSDRLALISALESWSDHLLGQFPLNESQLPRAQICKSRRVSTPVTPRSRFALGSRTVRQILIIKGVIPADPPPSAPDIPSAASPGCILPEFRLTVYRSPARMRASRGVTDRPSDKSGNVGQESGVRRRGHRTRGTPSAPSA